MAVRKLAEIKDLIGAYADFDRRLSGSVSEYPKDWNSTPAERLSQFFEIRNRLQAQSALLYDNAGRVIEEDFRKNIEDGMRDARPKGISNWIMPDFGEAEVRAHRELKNIASGTQAIIESLDSIYKDTIENVASGKPTMTSKIRTVLNNDLRGTTPQRENVIGTETAKKAFYKRVADDVNKKNRELIGNDLARSLSLQRSFNQLAYRSGQFQAWVANIDKICGWWWKSQLSSTTCPVCIFMHGSKHHLHESMDSHRNCRCEMVPILGNDLNKAPPVETGEEWFNRQSEEEKLRILGPSRYDLWSDGELTFSQFVGPYDDKLFGPSLQLTPLNQINNKTTAALEKQLMDDIGAKFPKLKGNIDLFGIGAELRVPILQILQDFGNKYPEAVGQMFGFVTQGSGKAHVPLHFSAEAHVSSHTIGGGEPWKQIEFQLVLKDTRYSSLKNARERQTNEFNQGWFSSDHPLAIVHHEMAHAVWNNLTNNYGNFFTDETGKTINDYYAGWLAKYHKEIDHVSNYAKDSKAAAMMNNSMWGPDRQKVLSHHEPEAENYANVATAQIKHDSAKMHVYFLDQMMGLIRDGTFKNRTSIPVSPTGVKGRRIRIKIAEQLDWNLRGGVAPPTAATTGPTFAAPITGPYVKFASIIKAKEWAKDNNVPYIPYTEREVGEIVRQTFINRGDVTAKNQIHGPKIAENWEKEYKGRLNTPNAKRVELQNAINNNYTNDLWQDITGRWGPEAIIFVNPEPGKEPPGAMERRGPTTVVYNHPFMLKYEPIETSIPGEATSGSLGGLSAELRHEYGHMIWDNFEDDERNRIRAKFGTDMKSIREGVTYYAGQDSYGKVETFCEIFAIITSKDYDRTRFPVWVGEAGDEIMKHVLNDSKTRVGSVQ